MPLLGAVLANMLNFPNAERCQLVCINLMPGTRPLQHRLYKNSHSEKWM